MRLLATVATWVGCACLLVNFTPLYSQVHSAQAQPKKRAKKAVNKSVRRCMKFKQSMGKDEESVDLRLTSSCKFEASCSLEWQVVCSSEPDAPAAELSTRSSTLGFQESWEVNASASTCEEDWEIQNVRWNCAASDS